MRVNSNNIYGPSTVGTQNTGRTSGRSGSRGADAYDYASLDNADVSQHAMMASRVMNKYTDIQATRVAELHSQVQSGTYSPDSAAVAGALVRGMLPESR